jgi:TetR/AcrR family transcriptional regulator, transcriptional repressor for nem operon
MIHLTRFGKSNRDDPAAGCPLSAIGSELGRTDEKTRAVATEGFLKLVEIMAGQFGKIPPVAARRRSLVGVSTMIGALTMSRIVTDPELSAEILKEAKKSITDK